MGNRQSFQSFLVSTGLQKKEEGEEGRGGARERNRDRPSDILTDEEIEDIQVSSGAGTGADKSSFG